MGNSIGRKKSTKVMKIDGTTMKLKTPMKASEVLKDYPGLVLLDSEAVKHYGSRAKPLEAHQNLEPKRLYFLIELPKAPKEKFARRVSSGINMTAKDRLESLMLARRSTSDLSIMKQASFMAEDSVQQNNSGPLRVRMRLPKAEVDRLIKESKDEAEAAEKIMALCVTSGDGVARNNTAAGNGVGHASKANKKRVSFPSITEREIQMAVSS